MYFPEDICLEAARPEDQHRHSMVNSLQALAESLPLVKPGSGEQRDMIERILRMTPDTGRIAPVDTIRALSQSVLWVGNEYIPHFAHAILVLEKPALRMAPNPALSALEQSLLVCYSVILPKNVHGIGRCNDVCIDWQRQTFHAILDTIETEPSIDCAILSGILRISETMSGMGAPLQDIHQRILLLMERHEDELTRY